MEFKHPSIFIGLLPTDSPNPEKTCIKFSGFYWDSANMD
jgi:hypothetical protein